MQILSQKNWGRAWESAFLTKPQVMMLVWAPRFEQQDARSYWAAFPALTPLDSSFLIGSLSLFLLDPFSLLKSLFWLLLSLQAPLYSWTHLNLVRPASWHFPICGLPISYRVWVLSSFFPSTQTFDMSWSRRQQLSLWWCVVTGLVGHT